MTIKQSQNPYGHRNLLAYKKAEELQLACAHLTSHFSHSKTLIALADQMNRSARSTKQNITEGWKRNSTKEYYEFLGYAVASNAELEEDCTDIWKGIYPELKGLRGIMGERGKMSDIEKIPFYPLDPNLPLVVGLKLRAKELNFLLDRLQKSLLDKMTRDHVLPTADKFKRSQDSLENEEKLYEKMLAEQGLMRLKNGKVVKRG